VIVTTSDLKLHCSSADERSSVYGALPVNSVIDNSNCGNVSRELWQSTVAKALTYTAQIEQIQQYVQTWLPYDHMSELQMLIKRSDWIDVSNFIHGPLGELRLKMTCNSQPPFRPSAGGEQRGFI